MEGVLGYCLILSFSARPGSFFFLGADLKFEFSNAVRKTESREEVSACPSSPTSGFACPVST